MGSRETSGAGLTVLRSKNRYLLKNRAKVKKKDNNRKGNNNKKTSKKAKKHMNNHTTSFKTSTFLPRKRVTNSNSYKSNRPLQLRANLRDLELQRTSKINRMINRMINRRTNRMINKRTNRRTNRMTISRMR